MNDRKIVAEISASDRVRIISAIRAIGGYAGLTFTQNVYPNAPRSMSWSGVRGEDVDPLLNGFEHRIGACRDGRVLVVVWRAVGFVVSPVRVG